MMQDLFPFKFNVSTLEAEAVVAYLRTIPSGCYRVDTREMVGELTLEEWQAVKAREAHMDAVASGDAHRVVGDEERSALLATDSDERVQITIEELPTEASRRTLNRVAIHTGVNNAGIKRDNWKAAFARGTKDYLIQFRDRDDAIMFKLAMWKRPDDEGAQ